MDKIKLELSAITDRHINRMPDSAHGGSLSALKARLDFTKENFTLLAEELTSTTNKYLSDNNIESVADYEELIRENIQIFMKSCLTGSK